MRKARVKSAKVRTKRHRRNTTPTHETGTQEKMLKKTATKGVCALFNAIAKHQKAKQVEESEENADEVKNLSKRNFLDMLKKVQSLSLSLLFSNK